MSEQLVWICPYCKGTYKSNYREMLERMKEIHYLPNDSTGEPICSELQLRRR